MVRRLAARAFSLILLAASFAAVLGVGVLLVGEPASAQNPMRLTGTHPTSGAADLIRTDGSGNLKVSGVVTAANATVTLVAPFRVSVGVSCVQLTASAGLKGVTIMPIAPGQTIYLGTDNTCSTANGFPLTNGQSASFAVTNSNQLWAVASAAAQAVAVFPYQ